MLTCASGFHDYWKTTRHAPDQQVMLAPEHWYVSFEATLKTPLTKEALKTVDRISQISLNPYYAKGKFEHTHDEAVSDYAVVVLGAPKDATYHPLPIYPFFVQTILKESSGFLKKKIRVFTPARARTLKRFARLLIPGLAELSVLCRKNINQKVTS